MQLNDNCCAECDFMKKYDYGKKIYYCDHPDRIDDMGKLRAGELPEGSPEWCPLGENRKGEITCSS